MTDDTKRLVLEMTIGMLVYEVILGILAVAFHSVLESIGFHLGPVLMGLLAGFIADLLMLLHMAYVTEKVAESMDENYANKTTLIHSMIRRVIFIVALFFLGSRPQIDAVAMIIGALSLQTGALLQPKVHRLFFTDRSESREKDTIEERRDKYGNDDNVDDAS